MNHHILNKLEIIANGKGKECADMLDMIIHDFHGILDEGR